MTLRNVTCSSVSKKEFHSHRTQGLQFPPALRMQEAESVMTCRAAISDSPVNQGPHEVLHFPNRAWRFIQTVGNPGVLSLSLAEKNRKVFPELLEQRLRQRAFLREHFLFPPSFLPT